MFSFGRKNKEGAVEITVSNSTVIRVLLLTIASFLFLGALHKATHALLLIFTALFLSLALNAPVHWLAERLPGRRRGSRTTATIVSFLVVIGLLFGFLASIVPPLVQQTNNFIHAAPQLIDDVRSEDSSLGNFVRRYKLEDQVNKFSGQLSDRLDNVTGSAVTTITKVGSSIFAVLTILVLTFMMLIEGPHWLKFGEQLLPKRQIPHVQRLLRDMYRVVKGYVNGQVTLAALAACLIAPALFWLHVSYPIALVVIVFICGLIPLVGHTIGAIIVTTVALFHSLPAALIILGYYILYQQVENYAIQPKIQANSTNMSPLLVFSSVIIGVSFGGLFGGLVAIPVAGCLRIAILDYLEARDILSAPEVDKAITPKS